MGCASVATVDTASIASTKSWTAVSLFCLEPHAIFDVSFAENGYNVRYSSPARCQCHEGWTGDLCDEQIPTPTLAPTYPPTAKTAVIDVNVKTLTGKTIRITLSNSAKVSELKSKIHAAEGIAVAQQRLIYSGTQLVDSNTLASYNIGDEAVVHLVLRLTG